MAAAGSTRGRRTVELYEAERILSESLIDFDGTLLDFVLRFDSNVTLICHLGGSAHWSDEHNKIETLVRHLRSSMDGIPLARHIKDYNLTYRGAIEYLTEEGTFIARANELAASGTGSSATLTAQQRVQEQQEALQTFFTSQGINLSALDASQYWVPQALWQHLPKDVQNEIIAVRDRVAPKELRQYLKLKAGDPSTSTTLTVASAEDTLRALHALVLGNDAPGGH